MSFHARLMGAIAHVSTRLRRGHRGLALALLLTAVCLGVRPAEVDAGNEFRLSPAEPSVARWRTWVLESGDDLRLARPPRPHSAQMRAELAELRELQETRTDQMAATAQFWSTGPATMRWTEKQLQLVVQYRPNPPRASRGLALVHIAMYDAVVAAWDSKYAFHRVPPERADRSIKPLFASGRAPSYPSEHAVVAGAAARVLGYLFPEEASNLEQLAEQAALSRLWAGVNYRSDVERGLMLGRAVGDLVIARAQTDGSTAAWDGSERLTGPGYWEPTPPGFVFPPIEPLWGSVRPWLLPSGDAFRPTAPPTFGSAAFIADYAEVETVGNNLTDEQKQIALFWADGPGTLTPPGHWTQIALDLALRDNLSTPRVALALALVNAAQADAFIACWDAKFHYWSARPVTVIRQLSDPMWAPFITTPPFPGYVSGHSTASGAAAEVLSFLFPQDAEPIRGQAEEAARSRLYGGIHTAFDNEEGLRLGRRIGELAIDWIHNNSFEPRRRWSHFSDAD